MWRRYGRDDRFERPQGIAAENLAELLLAVAEYLQELSFDNQSVR
jgi:hypothetical protein